MIFYVVRQPFWFCLSESWDRTCPFTAVSFIFLFFLVAVIISYTAKHKPTPLICRISVCTPGHGWAEAWAVKPRRSRWRWGRTAVWQSGGSGRRAAPRGPSPPRHTWGAGRRTPAPSDTHPPPSPPSDPRRPPEYNTHRSRWVPPGVNKCQCISFRCSGSHLGVFCL